MSNPTNNSPKESSVNDSTISGLTKEKITESNTIKIPEISLPKGGGALKSIDEKFEVNAANGTASFTIPLPVTPGRNNFSPTLALSYSSGAGNSPFGLGWSIGYPIIQRKTDKKLPLYQDGTNEDTFMFSGVEDLVPFLKNDGTPLELTFNEYTIKRYRPRIEGSFSRIERIHHPDHGLYWKVTSGNNIATIYGRSNLNRTANPLDENKIFQWMPEFSYDDKGNWIIYEFKQEDLVNVTNSDFEKNRIAGVAPFTNNYLKRIKYGNRKAYYANPNKPYDPQWPSDQEHFFELVFDYGEHDENNPTPQDIGKWSYRLDAFSSYRSGFEIRNNRLCKRILMFHHFENEKQFNRTSEEENFGKNYLVRSLDLTYEPSSINQSSQSETTYLKSITQSGYIRKPDGTYSKKSLPPMEFAYEKLNWNKDIKKVKKENAINAPVGLTNNYQWVDLYGEGINGIFSEQASGWYYKSNLGTINEDGELSFGPVQKVISKPSFNGIINGVLTLQDLESDGQKQVVVRSNGLQGYFEMDKTTDWKPFKPFESNVNVNFQDPNTRLIDISGNGQPDLLITEENAFTWYTADGKKGHLPLEKAIKETNEEQGPAIVFADELQTIFLADMSGDGLTDIVRIRNGEICYWANKGYGQWSAKISMSNAPVFDSPDLFNPKYLHLADVSGTGATDVLYLGQNAFKAFINLSGNAWSNAHLIEPFFSIDSNSQISVIDLLGRGTSCIVWSSDLKKHANEPLQYIDLMNGRKPHVLISSKNNLGKETTIQYESSTHYYLKDKLYGKPWITKLPFPVQVVKKLVVEEKITNVRFTTEYSYHHGFYDSFEREFRGFGMVEQLDSEFYYEWIRNNSDNRIEKSEINYQKPILTKTWFHTGVFIDRKNILTKYKNEYWQEEFKRQFPQTPLNTIEPELPDAHISETFRPLNVQELREALRACKGMLLRQEIFALDAPKNPTEEEHQKQHKPYSVATHNCTIHLIQPSIDSAYAVFNVTESEAIYIWYERDETDYRITHNLNTKIDELGNVLESAQVVYGRQEVKANAHFQLLVNGVADFSEDVLNNNTSQKVELRNAFNQNIQSAKEEQLKTHIVYTQNSFCKYNDGIVDQKDIDLPHAYHLRLPFETKTYELTGITAAEGIFKMIELENALNFTTEIKYHEDPVGSNKKRLIEHVKTKYLSEDLNPLNFGFFDLKGLIYESYQLALTFDLIANCFKKQDGTELQSNGQDVSTFIEALGSYSKIDTDLWIRSGIMHYKSHANETISKVKDRFFSPIGFEDPFGEMSSTIYDTETFTGQTRNNDGYYLFVKSVKDPLDNIIQVDVFNYRIMSPSRMFDLNANPSSVLFDELGLVKALALEGKGEFSDATRTAVTLIESADGFNGLKEYTTTNETINMSELFGSATFNSTNTNQLRQAGNHLLRESTIRFAYDFDCYKRIIDQNNQHLNNGEPEKIKPLSPAKVVSIKREEHFAINNNSKIQFAFEYSDGLGNIVMIKGQAEPGEASFIDETGNKQLKDTGTDLRWIGNGRTVLNNKGKPIKQFEPYFSTNFLYEDDPGLVEIGVTPILYYDALGRLIKTKLADGSLERVEFDSWHQVNYDRNDTVGENECDWFKRRTDPTHSEFINNPEEQRAANAALEHSNTPLLLFFDSLGRSILSISNNGKDVSQKMKWHSTFIQMDIEGNTRAVRDPLGNTVMVYKNDILGRRIYQKSMDGGERWMLFNLVGNPLKLWNDRNFLFSFEYDELQRPTRSRVQGGVNDLDHNYGVIDYGDKKNQSNADRNAKLLNNQLGNKIVEKDTSGVTFFMDYDFKGNLLESRKQLIKK